MSDVLTIDSPASDASSVPAFVSRLRAGRYTSPAGVESSFLFDSLSRSRAKKTAVHEVVDSDETILQDMGSSLHVFALEVYFVGENCDTEADAFYASLYERYTPDEPGILNHPRWGDVAVIPFGSPEQNESFVGGGVGIARVTVEFRETKSQAFAAGSKLSASGIADAAKKIDANALERAQKMVTESKVAYAKFKASIKGKVSIVTGFIDGVKDLITDVREEVDAMVASLLSAIDEGATPVVIMSQVGQIIQTIAAVPQTTADVVMGYYDMASDMISSYGSDIANASMSEEKTNLALAYQYMGAMSTVAVAMSAVNVTYETRDDVAGVLDDMTDAYAQYLAQMAAASASLSNGIATLFVPDHDVGSDLYGAIYNGQALLLDRAFSLASRRTYILRAPSDALTETWTHYGDLDRLDFYCRTNKIVGSEFVEIPAGRELVWYE